MHVESSGDGAAALAGGQAPEGLSLLMIAELSRPFWRCPELARQLNPSKAAFDPTDYQVRPSLAAMVCRERRGLP